MHRKAVSLLLLVLFPISPTLAVEPLPPPPATVHFKRGAHKLSPPLRRLRATRKWHTTQPFPPQWSIVSPKNSLFLNDQFGDCVLAGEAVNINANAFYRTGQPLIIADEEIKRWAVAHDVLNGADLLEVINLLSPSLRDGLNGPPLPTAAMFCDGIGSPVNVQDRANICSACYACKGSLKMGVAADDLELVNAGQRNGWYLPVSHSTNIDHDVELLGYGPASYCFRVLATPLPAGCDPSTFCYLVNTWGTVGVVAGDVVESSGWCDEIDVRNPTSIVMLPVPAPTPVPPSPPVPPVPPVPPSPPTPPTPRPCPRCKRGAVRHHWFVDAPRPSAIVEVPLCPLA